MSRLLVFLGLSCAFPVFSRAGDDFPSSGKFSVTPGQISAKEFARKLETNSGLKIDLSNLDEKSEIPGDLRDIGYWHSLEHLAKHTKSHLVLLGGKIILKPVQAPVSADIRGPFRFSARELSLRKDLATGATICDLQLEAAWLPSVLAYRIDASPKIDSVTDDAGNKYEVSSAGARVFTSGTNSPLLIRPLGLKRAAKSLNVAGSMRITIADELLDFNFDATGKNLGKLAQKGVNTTIRKVGNEGTSWFADVELTYPPTSAVWESYEIYWTRNNRMRLITPAGEPIKPDDVEFGDRSIRYVFKNRAGKVGPNWTLDYQTPGPMRELKVPFELKGIELP